MKARLPLVAAVTLSLLASPAVAADKVKIGFVGTFSGSSAIIGKQMKDAFELALDHLDRKIGGLPVEVVYGDDQVKPDTARQVVDAMLKRDKVDFITGIIWSNVAMAIYKPIVDAKVFMISANASPSPLSGKLCNPYIFTLSWQNDANHEAAGQLIQDDKVKNLFLMAPNYQAGKDSLTGVKRFYKGKVTGEILFPLGASDFQAELGQVRAAKPDALFIFAPGGMGIAFLKQWQASGLASQFKLYTAFTVDYVTLPVVGDAALGSIHTNYWDPDGKFPANVKFIADFKKKYGYMPSHFAAQAYDVPAFLDSGVKAVKGNLDDKQGLIKDFRKANFQSVRGPFTFNVNQVPIENFYKREVVKGPDGKPVIHTTGVVFTDHKDAYYKDCKMKY